jgi:hydroxypyruvate isomerase
MTVQPDVLFDLFFKDLPLPERLGRIAATGWRRIETWKGGDPAEMKQIGDACRANGLELVSIVMNGIGDKDAAPIGTGNAKRFAEQIDRYSDNALSAGCHAGIVTTGNRVSGVDYYRHKQNLVEALGQASAVAARKGFLLNLEPLNDKVNHAGYFLVSREDTLDVIRQVASPHVKALYDLYHMQIMTGDHVAFLLAHLPLIGHFHSAGVPGRQELFLGEMNYPYVIRRILEAGYTGTFGLEYMPSMPDEKSLRDSLAYVAPAFG